MVGLPCKRLHRLGLVFGELRRKNAFRLKSAVVTSRRSQPVGHLCQLQDPQGSGPRICPPRVARLAARHDGQLSRERTWAQCAARDFPFAMYWPCMQGVGGRGWHLPEQPLRLVFADRRSGTQSPANQTLPSSPPADHLCPAHLRLARGGQPHRDPGAAPAQGLLVQGPGEAQLAQVPGLDPAQGVVRFRSDVLKTLFTM